MATTMKIAVDCADLDCSRIDGTRIYIKNLLDWFGKLDTQNKFLLYHRENFNKKLEPKTFPNYIDRTIPYPWWWTQTRFAFELRTDKSDVCWMPIQQIPFIGPKETRYVVTIHDLAFKLFPSHFPKKDRLKINFFTQTAISRADKIIAISNSTKKDILKFYPKIKEEKIKVIYHGFDVELFSKEYSQEEKLKVLKKYKISGVGENNDPGFILYVGAIQPRKNLVVLIDAFEKIKRTKKNANLKLVFVGEKAWLAEKTISKVKFSEFSRDIVVTGKVGYKELSILYQEAKVFVFPSLYEGFGIPILEAFASKTPVVVADNSSLVEIGGDAIEKFSSSDKDQLSDILQNILNNRTMREKMILKGTDRAKRFSWRKCAGETLSVIKEI